MFVRQLFGGCLSVMFFASNLFASTFLDFCYEPNSKACIDMLKSAYEVAGCKIDVEKSGCILETQAQSTIFDCKMESSNCVDHLKGSPDEIKCPSGYTLIAVRGPGAGICIKGRAYSDLKINAVYYGCNNPPYTDTRSCELAAMAHFESVGCHPKKAKCRAVNNIYNCGVDTQSCVVVPRAGRGSKQNCPVGTVAINENSPVCRIKIEEQVNTYQRDELKGRTSPKDPSHDWCKDCPSSAVDN